MAKSSNASLGPDCAGKYGEALAAAVRGRLRVNVHPFFARLALAPRLKKFLAAYLSCRWRSWDATVSATSWPTGF
jgi:DNA-binding transcriptional LysR family regulator